MVLMTAPSQQSGSACSKLELHRNSQTHRQSGENENREINQSDSVLWSNCTRGSGVLLAVLPEVDKYHLWLSTSPSFLLSTCSVSLSSHKKIVA